MPGPDTIVGRKIVDLSQGVEPGVIHFFHLRAIDSVLLPDGAIGQWEYNYTPEGIVTACVAAFTPDGRMVLVHRHRAGADWMHELPGGDTRGAETPQEAALRELREETGYATSEPLVLLSRGFVSPAHTNVPLFIYHAPACTPTHKPSVDPMEQVAGLRTITAYPKDVVSRMAGGDGYFNDNIARALLMLQARALIAL